MKDLHKYLIYILPILGIGAFILLSRQQQQQAVTPTATQTTTDTYEGTESPELIYGQTPAQAPAPVGQDGMVEVEVAEPEMVEVTQTYTTQQEQDCAYAWLTQSCPTYQEKGCYTATLTNHTMTGDGTHYFTYTSNYFKEGEWGIPIPATMTFTVIIKNCQVTSHSYRET